MSANKFLYLGIISMLLLTSGTCNKDLDDEVDRLDTQIRNVIAICDALNAPNESRVYIFSLSLNDKSVIVFESERSVNTFNLNGNGVGYSYSVDEFGPRTGKARTTKSYTGTLNDAAFIINQKNKVDIVRNGEEWQLLVNGKNEDVGGGNGGGGNSGGGGTTSSPYGIWQRYGSPGGYQTDLAIGNIPGQSANRVYMCEHPGSPSAGLYKGYITGNTITWDAIHNLPDAVFNSIDPEPNRSLYFGVGDPSDAGKYKKGIWTNTCPM